MNRLFLVFQGCSAISTTRAHRTPATRARSATPAPSMDPSLAPAPLATRGWTARRTSTSASRVSATNFLDLARSAGFSSLMAMDDRGVLGEELDL